MYEYRASVVRVVDGDTIDVLIDLGMNISVKERLRLYGIDAPEVRGVEREGGLLSSAFLQEAILHKDIVVKTIKDKKGKYGRYLAIVVCDGADINAKMVESGHAEACHY